MYNVHVWKVTCSGSTVCFEVLDEVWLSSFPQLNKCFYLICESILVWFLQEDIEGMVELNLVLGILD